MRLTPSPTPSTSGHHSASQTHEHERIRNDPGHGPPQPRQAPSTLVLAAFLRTHFALAAHNTSTAPIVSNRNFIAHPRNCTNSNNQRTQRPLAGPTLHQVHQHQPTNKQHHEGATMSSSTMKEEYEQESQSQSKRQSKGSRSKVRSLFSPIFVSPAPENIKIH